MIFYIPGNHDHLLWALHIFHDHIINRFETDMDALDDFDFGICSDQGGNENVYRGKESFLCKAFGSERIAVVYPWVKAVINEEKYLFAHGHHFDRAHTVMNNMSEGFFKGISKVLGLGFDKIDIKTDNEYEYYNAAYYQLVTYLGRTTKGRRQMKAWLDKITDVLPNKVFPEELVKTIKQVVLNYAGEWPPADANKFYDDLKYIVFGHTHFAYMSELKDDASKESKQRIYCNTGCWIPYTEAKQEKRIGSFVTIDSNDKTNRGPVLWKMEKIRNDYIIKEHATSEEVRIQRKTERE
jgi:UDP-2,3-diacylglucosamine pyrophosphatase LpxH